MRTPAGGTARLVVDLEGDGAQDAVLGLPGAPGIALLENTGDSFAAPRAP